MSNMIDESFEDTIREFVKLDTNDKNRLIIYERLLKETYYRLPLNAIVKNEEESHAILRRIKREWSDNEVKWRRLFQEQEEQTRCRAVRSMSGSISYIDINTGETVSSADYEVRYMTYVEASKKKVNCTSDFQLPPLQKPSIMSLLISNSNIGWYPYEVSRIELPDDLSGGVTRHDEINNVENLSCNSPVENSKVHDVKGINKGEVTNNVENNSINDSSVENNKVHDVDMYTEDQNSQKICASEDKIMECEFESPISIAEDWPLKRLKTNA